MARENRVDPTRMPGFVGYVLKKDGNYFIGTGYGGPGVTVPYWGGTKSCTPDSVKIWKRLADARKAMEKYGGELRAVKVNERTGTLSRIWGWGEGADN